MIHELKRKHCIACCCCDKYHVP